MNELNFEQLDFTKGFVESGAKVMQSNRPEIILNSTHNRFTVNDKGMDLMGIKPKDKIWFNDMLDMSDDKERRFFVAPNVVIDGETKGATVGNNKGFTYSRVYGAMLASLAGINTKEIKFEELERIGLMQSAENKEGRKSFVSTKKIAAELVEVTDNDGNVVKVPVGTNEDGSVVTSPVYMLTNFIVSSHTPQFTEEGEEAEEQTNDEIEEVDMMEE